jgi:diaminopimelate epimerase
MELSFSKYQGAGNDFIIIDDRSACFPAEKELISRLCHRKYGIGADGLILLQKSLAADYRMNFYNSDGSRPGMCGNGLRCLASFIKSLGLTDDCCSIESPQGIHSIKFMGDKVAVSMGTPKVQHWELPLVHEGQALKAYVIHSGVPHAVFFLDEIENVNLDHLGKQVRFSPLFSPEGVNVNIVTVAKPSSLCIRTYERGVEGETLACGTGAVAAAYAASLVFGLNSPIQILPASKETLEVVRENKEGEMFLIGSAAFVFSGKVCI